jgi:hypothetical protein
MDKKIQCPCRIAIALMRILKYKLKEVIEAYLPCINRHYNSA